MSDTRRPTSRGIATVSLSPEQFAQLRDRLATYSGVYLDLSRQRVLETDLARRLGGPTGDLAQYMRLISAPEGAAELQGLAEAVLNHETFFFRNKPHMRALREVVLPELHRRKPLGAPIRLWSAGCSTGEEPYTLAMALLDAGWAPQRIRIDLPVQKEQIAPRLAHDDTPRRTPGRRDPIDAV